VRPGRRLLLAAAAVALAATPAPVAAQAFTVPRHVGAVTVAWQYISNTGHRLSDGYYRPTGESVSTSALAEVEYGVTARLSASVGLPYVWAKYTGAQPPPSGLPVDKCACWSSSFADFGFSARYRFGGETWAVTPLVRYGLPSHDYAYQGEAVVGRDLNDLQLGLAGGLRLGGFLSRATVQATYGYSFVESPLPDVSIDKSTLFVDFGYAVSSGLYARAFGTGVYTHGGLRAGSPTGNPFPFPGELAPIGGERWLQRDRLLATKYWQLGGGLSYSLGSFDVFASYSNYVWGRDAHNGWSLNLGTTWYFER
jgi:hypothetical protein